MPSAIDVFRSKLKARLKSYGDVSEFCRTAKLQRSAVDRWLKDKGGPSLESLDRIALAFGEEPWQLLQPAPQAVQEVPIPGLPRLIQELKKLDQGQAAKFVEIFLEILNPDLVEGRIQDRELPKKPAKR